MAVSKFAEFDKQMSAVQAATHETAANMDLLREAALDAGARTVFSATEAAAAVEELAKAGVSTADILSGGLDAALDLASAGGMGVAEAAGIAAVALKTFNLQGSDMSHVADLLAAGAGKAMGDVSDLSMALAQGGQVAKATGLSIEETTAALAAFASEGLLGSDAGTSLKTMLQRLTPQSKEAADKFRELGISAYDANGEFVGLANFSGQLQSAMKDLTPEARSAAMNVMFGVDAVRAANVLCGQGEQGIRDWISAVDDQGYAAETAAARLDNLLGDWEAFTGALDTAFITMGEGANGPLRDFVQGLTSMVDWFNALPDEAQQTLLAVGAVAGAVGLAGGAALLAVPQIAAFKAGLVALNITAASVKGSIGSVLGALGNPWVLGIAAAVTSVTLLVRWMESMQATADEMANAAVTAADSGELLKKAYQGLGDGMTFFDEDTISAENFQKNLDTISEIQENWWARFSHGFDGHAGLRDALENVDEGIAILTRSGKMDDAHRAFQMLADKTDGSKKQLLTLLETMPKFKEALVTQATELGISADEASLLDLAMGKTNATLRSTSDTLAAAEDAAAANADALAVMKAEAEAAEKRIDDLAQAIRGFGAEVLNTRDAQRQFEQATDDLWAALEQNGATLDINEASGRANEAALDSMAHSALEYAASLVQQTGDQAAATQAIEDGRLRLVDALAQFGITGDAAQQYADQLGLIPGNVATTVDLQAEAAQSEVDRFIELNNGKSLMLYAGLQIEDPAGRYGVDSVPHAAGGVYNNGVMAFKAGGIASGMRPDIYPATKGGIHKFAEAGYPEGYVSLDPKYQDRSRDIVTGHTDGPARGLLILLGVRLAAAALAVPIWGWPVLALVGVSFVFEKLVWAAEKTLVERFERTI